MLVAYDWWNLATRLWELQWAHESNFWYIGKVEDRVEVIKPEAITQFPVFLVFYKPELCLNLQGRWKWNIGYWSSCHWCNWPLIPESTNSSKLQPGKSVQKLNHLSENMCIPLPTGHKYLCFRFMFMHSQTKETKLLWTHSRGQEELNVCYPLPCVHDVN